ncbi:MAG TPA: hypothetical protein VL308_09345 [Gemmatimonadaceae bacterium]|jgi:hypothetical protein|nr:hypothetical protein [Gemmatimonadaceae bacterium]
MAHSAAIPFLLHRRHDVVGVAITTTRETIHGLLRLDGDQLHVQWRIARSTDHVGMTIRSDKEIEPVREVVIPLSAIAGAAVKWRWRWPPGPHLLLTAADLRAFEEVAGTAGLSLDHPAELELRLRRSDRALGAEFASELELAVADREIAEQQGPGTSGLGTGDSAEKRELGTGNRGSS